MNVAALSEIEASSGNVGMKIPLKRRTLSPSGYGNAVLNRELNP